MDAMEPVVVGCDSKPSLRNLTNDFGKIPDASNPLLQELGAPHIESFNFIVNGGLSKIKASIGDLEFKLPTSNPLTDGQRLRMHLSEINLYKPAVPSGNVGSRDSTVFPTECRQRGTTYGGTLEIEGTILQDKDNTGISFTHNMGEIPIMVRSALCNLHKMTPRQLVEHGEHAEEFGGYFIIKGYERLIRMLLTTRRNYPIAVQRSSWKNRGKNFSDLGVMIRCVSEDQSCTNNVLHYLKDGSVQLMVGYQGHTYYFPIVLLMKALLDVPDSYIYKKLSEKKTDDQFFLTCVRQMLSDASLSELNTHEKIKEHIGEKFCFRLRHVPEWKTNAEVCDIFVKNTVLTHLSQPEDKFNMLVFMVQKLFSLVQNKTVAEGVDSVMMQEIVLGGHIYLQLLKHNLEMWMISLKHAILQRAEAVKEDFVLTKIELHNCLNRTSNISRAFESFLAVGKIDSKVPTGLQQTTGLTIVAENINRMRYMSHFKAVHRGSFFVSMRTTEARVLLPDAWGFICPVHTPDGSPCGLLNHLTSLARVVNSRELVDTLPEVLVDIGMVPYDQTVHNLGCDYYIVMLDGKLVGQLHKDKIVDYVSKLRMLKVDGKKVSKKLEIAFVPSVRNGQFPGLFLFTGEARMIRPVKNLRADKTEWIGTFEQVYLDICIQSSGRIDGITTHQELSNLSMLSNLAQLTPLSDYNQSPRNMYQCQMGKQTMGTPCHNWHLQTDTKLYRLQTPTSPLFRPVYYDLLGLDEFAMGTNAIVAVISYTGYDMEDAMVLNKSSLERGFAYGSIYKTKYLDLKDETKNTKTQSYFQRDPDNELLELYLDSDGLPYIGTHLTEMTPYFCYYNAEEERYIVEKYKDSEMAIVNNVTACGSGTLGNNALNHVALSFRVPRPPAIGDKFASRAGQKGICSQQWPSEDMPFTESGVVPDIIFNPHGFPSRMTIAMMIELMAGKSAAIHGLVHDATPFRFTESDTAIDYFGKLLSAAGYNYFGTETMYSGITGREMTAKIFFGICYYQRLRHMVSDKFQARSTGPTDITTHQPIKGRRRGGGVRFGEMERDSLISHGTSFLLQDRLVHCSDKIRVHVCVKCGSFMSTVVKVPYDSEAEPLPMCNSCKDTSNIGQMSVPQVFRLSIYELLALGIKVDLDIQHR